MSGTEAGWYPDPTSPHIERRWDGTQWTPETRPAVPPSGQPRVAGNTNAQDPSARIVLSWAVIVGGALLAIGTLMAWLTASDALLNVSRNAFQLGPHEGLTADGPIVLVLGLVLTGIGISRLTRSSMPRFVQRSPVVAALGACIVMGLEYPSVHNWVSQVSSSTVLASIGVGYWICCLGAIVALLAGLRLLHDERAEKAESKLLLD